MTSSSKFLDRLQGLPPRYFEQLVADVWEEHENWATEVMDEGADHGLDVMGQPPDSDVKTAVQCKRYKSGNKVKEPHIREYAALRQQWSDVEGVTVVTTSSFTRNALEIAERLDVNCIDGEDLVQIIDMADARDIARWYITGKPTES